MELDSADKAKAVLAELLGAGILINRAHETVLRFLPPYIIQPRQVDEVIAALDSALGQAPPSTNKTGAQHTPAAGRQR